MASGEGKETETVYTLHEWLLQEAHFAIIGSETVNGIGGAGNIQTELVSQDDLVIEDSVCRLCSGSHSILDCEEFLGMTVPKRWESARLHRLCFRCLSAFHIGRRCPSSQLCKVDNCQQNHHRLLHRVNRSD